MAITCFTDDDWRVLAQIAGRPDWLADLRFATLSDRMTHHDELDMLVEEWTRQLDPYQVTAALQEAGVAAGVCRTAGDRCDNDPQLRHLNWLTELTGTLIGTWPLAEMPVKMSRTPPHIGGQLNRAAPLYGEDNVDMLTGLLGMSVAEIEALAEEGVL